MDIIYVLVGLLLVAYEAVENFIRATAAFVGGGGVLLALVLAFIALFTAHSADDKADKLAKQVEELQEKLEETEEDEDD